MKVALVMDGVGFGGIERVAVNYSEIFLELGYEVDIYNLKPEFNEMEECFPEECKFIHKAIPEWILPDRYMLIVKRWRWGKYLYPLIYAGTSILLCLYRMTMGKRKRYDLTVAFSGHFRDLVFVANNFIVGNKKMCWLHGSLMDYLLLSTTFGDLYRKINNLCTLSDSNQRYTLLANHFLSELNIHKIHNPIHLADIDMDQELVNELKRKYGSFLLMVGRFADDKDQKTVIHAVKILKEEYKIENKVLFVGDGDTLEDCQNYADAMGVADQVEFIGARNDVQSFYMAAHLFIHSSPAEGLPTVLLEAMKYGVPIVATNSLPGVTEILKNDMYGLRCEVGDAHDMAEKVSEMLEDEKKREHYIKMGYERIKDFSDEVIKEQLKEIIKTLK